MGGGKATLGNGNLVLLAILSAALLLYAGAASPTEAQTSPTVVGTTAKSDKPPAQLEELSGILDVVWVDPTPGSGRRPTVEYTLTDDRGEKTELVLDEETAQPAGGLAALTGDRVEVTGTGQPGERIEAEVITPEEPQRGASVTEGRTVTDAAALTGPRPTATVLCRFGDSTGVTPHPSSFFGTLMGGSSPGMDNYWRESSYDNINLNGSQVFGWYNMPQPRSYYGSDTGKLFDDCTQAADTDVFFPNFANVNIVLNQFWSDPTVLAKGGTASWNIDGQFKTYGATWLPPFQGTYEHETWAHEFGHSFGFAHSLAPNGDEYGSDWDVMSGASACRSPHPDYSCLGQHTIAYSKDSRGWIPTARKYTASPESDQTVTIERLALPSAGNYLVARVPISGSTTRFYTVEARRFAGYDAEAPGEAVVIHDVDLTRNPTRAIPPVARIVDGDNDGDANDAGTAWVPGETFTDAANGISVQVTGQTTSGYSVRIRTGPPAADSTPPAVTLTSPAAAGSIARGANLTLSADATDNVGVTRVEFLVDGAVVGTDTTATDNSFGVDWDSTATPDGRSTVTARAYDAVGNDATAGREVVVDNTYPDTRITAGPAEGSTTSQTTASFSFDNPTAERDVTFMCSLDGAAYATCASPKSYQNLSAGQHTFSVKAVGAAGEAADSDPTPATRTWTVEGTAPTPTVFQENNRDRTDFGFWRYYKNASFSDGYSAFANTAGESASFTFTGTSVAWLTNRLPDGGRTDVFLDGAKVKTVDTYSARPSYGKVGFYKGGLANGTHTLRLVVTGTKNAASSNTYTEIDRFVVNGKLRKGKLKGGTTYQDNAPEITFGPWKGVKDAGASGGSYRQSAAATPGAWLLNVTGPYVDLISARGPDRGVVTFQLFDAETNALVGQATADLNAQSSALQTSVRITGLDPTKRYHLRVASGDGKPVAVDAFRAFPAAAAQQTATAGSYAEKGAKPGVPYPAEGQPPGDEEPPTLPDPVVESADAP